MEQVTRQVDTDLVIGVFSEVGTKLGNMQRSEYADQIWRPIDSACSRQLLYMIIGEQVLDGILPLTGGR